jgi:hypothetical protein
VSSNFRELELAAREAELSKAMNHLREHHDAFTAHETECDASRAAVVASPTDVEARERLRAALDRRLEIENAIGAAPEVITRAQAAVDLARRKVERRHEMAAEEAR